RIISSLNSLLSSAFLLLFNPTPTYTLLKSGKARERISTCAMVIGSKEPGNKAILSSFIALNIIFRRIFKKAETRLPVLPFFPESRQSGGVHQIGVLHNQAALLFQEISLKYRNDNIGKIMQIVRGIGKYEVVTMCFGF